MRHTPPMDPRFSALVDLLGRTGVGELQFRYDDDPQPTVWIAVGKWKNRWECAAGLNPLDSAMRLAERAADGGICAHCHKIVGISDQWDQPMPLQDDVCWYVYDPEVKKFRRSCEAEFPKGI